jgi:hypothetical protein
MASIISEVTIDAAPADVWAALRDFHAVHERLVPGFVLASEPVDDVTRLVTFFNGAKAREVLVGVDEKVRRLCYTVVEGPLQCTHHNASAQVLTDPTSADRSHFVWITDVLPDDRALSIGEMMQRGIEVIERTLAR